jgi:2-dehydro-3-deoxyphosphooctonate aldolase (KDO 8-P synthase)
MGLYKKLKENSDNFFLIAGPCVIENREMPFEIAEKLIEITNKLNILFVFKASYRKANRSSIDSFSGIGDLEGLEILKKVKQKYNIPVITDIHSKEEAILAADYVDILQIPAFLCRQTDILLAAANTKKIVNVKKGQFLSADSMKFVVEKINREGNNQIMLTDRGTMFGYQDLIVDFRSIPIMQENNVPVIMDITHSLQQPNQTSGVAGGQPKMIETIAKASVAIGVDGLFMETHPNPKEAKSDGANMLSLDLVPELMEKLVRIKKSII